MRAANGSVIFGLVVASFIACGGTTSTPSTGVDAGAGDGAVDHVGGGGNCPAGKVARTEAGICPSGYGVTGVTDGCCTPCSDADAGVLMGCPAACPTYDGVNKACGTAADCATIARGCYCGAQPVIGIAKQVQAKAMACEADAMAHCALGCPNMPGQQAEDGQNNQDGGAITVLCDQGACRTVLQ
jgi:hypothetical protein